MLKPSSLGALLLASIAQLQNDPTRLGLFVDKGRIVCTGTRALSFEYRYTLNVVVQDYAGDINDLVVPLLGWIAVHQRDLLDREGHEPFTFEADLLDGDSADVSIDLELTERVKVDVAAGRFTAVNLPEPPVDDSFAGAAPAHHWSLLMNGDQVLPA